MSEQAKYKFAELKQFEQWSKVILSDEESEDEMNDDDDDDDDDMELANW